MNSTDCNSHNIDQSWIALTAKCNNRCRYCYYGHSLGDSSMPFQKAKNTIDLLLELGAENCAFVGGEPTLYGYLIDLISYSYEKGMKIGLVTNGRKLRDVDLCSRIIDAGVDRVSISIEGTKADIHDSITQSIGSYVETVSGINNMIKKGFKVDAITTICESNQSDLLKMIDFLVNLGMQDAVFNLCTPSIASLHSGEFIHPLRIGELLDNIMEYRINDIRITVVTPFPPCLTKSSAFKDRAGTCQMHHGNGVTIDVDGSVLPCTHFPQASLFNLFKKDGVLSPREFLSTWDTEGKKFRESLWVYPSEKCVDCEIWGRCYGGCPLFWTEYDLGAIHRSIEGQSGKGGF